MSNVVPETTVGVDLGDRYSYVPWAYPDSVDR